MYVGKHAHMSIHNIMHIRVYSNTCTLIHTKIHAHNYFYNHLYTLLRACSFKKRIQVHLYTLTQTDINSRYTYIHTLAHMHVQNAYRYIYTPSLIQTHPYRYILTYGHTIIPTLISSLMYAQTYKHTNIHIHTHNALSHAPEHTHTRKLIHTHKCTPI